MGEEKVCKNSHQKALSYDFIAKLINSKNPLDLLFSICLPYCRPWSLRQINSSKLHACVDDRAYNMRLFVDPGGSIVMRDLILRVERIKTDDLLHRHGLPVAAWPGGDVGIMMQVMISALRGGYMQKQNYWKETNPQKFTTQMIAHIQKMGSVISNQHETAVHIDNHRELPIVEVDEVHGWRPHEKNIYQCMEDAMGCGAAFKTCELVCNMVLFLGDEKLASQLSERFGGSIHGYEVSIPSEISTLVNRTLIHDSLSRGKSILVYTGKHHAEEIVFTTGDQSSDRVINRINDSGYAGFKTDLMVGFSHAVHWQIMRQVNERFGNQLGNPLSYIIGINLLTYHLLGQSTTPRYII